MKDNTTHIQQPERGGEAHANARMPATPLKRCVKCGELIIPRTWEEQFDNICEPCFRNGLDGLSFLFV